MFDQEILVQRAIVVVVVTTRGGAGVEGEIRVARAGRPDVLVSFGMTGDAEIHRDGDSAGACDLGAMLHVTGRAKTTVELFPVGGHPGTAKLRARVDVVAVLQCIFVAIPACLVQLLFRRFGIGERGRGVAGLAGHFKLVVSVGGGADKKHSTVTADDHQDNNDDHGNQRGHRGHDREDDVTGQRLRSCVAPPIRTPALAPEISATM